MERIGARWMIDNAVKSEWKPDRSSIIPLTMPPIRNETSTISKLIDLLPEKYFHPHFQNPQDLRTNCKKNSHPYSKRGITRNRGRIGGDRALEKVFPFSMGRIDRSRRYATKIRQWVLELPRNATVKPSNELLRGQPSSRTVISTLVPCPASTGRRTVSTYLSPSLSSFAAHFLHHSAVRMHRAKPCARLIREHYRHYPRPKTGRNEILVGRTVHVVICGILSFVINREAWKSVPQSLSALYRASRTRLTPRWISLMEPWRIFLAIF